MIIRFKKRRRIVDRCECSAKSEKPKGALCVSLRKIEAKKTREKEPRRHVASVECDCGAIAFVLRDRLFRDAEHQAAAMAGGDLS